MSDVLLEIEQGQLRGATDKDYHGGKFYKFLGIPYAKSPVGELRFKSPQPAEPWKGIFNATKPGPECPSADMFFNHFLGNEDNCLHLNIYTKELPKDKNALKNPVMVWIHGGAFMMGNNKPDLYGPEYFMTEDIVLVTINYRLGIFGFSSFKDQSLGVPGNAGLKDQRLALKWIQKNIATFGGDSKNVTIFGESAGSASVHYLTLSASTEGLFHKAIMQSGSALNSWGWGRAGNSADIQKHMGYKDSDEKTIFEKLKKESQKSIVRGQSRLKETFECGKIRPWGPVVEPPSPDAFLTEHPSKIMNTRGAHKIPMIIGYNSGEGIFFELVRKTVPGAVLPKDLEYEIPFELGIEKGTVEAKKIANKLKDFYFDGADCTEENISKMWQLKGDNNFVHKIQKVMTQQAVLSPEPIYAYRFSLVSSLNFFHLFAMAKGFKRTIFNMVLIKVSQKCVPCASSTFQNMLVNRAKKESDGVVHADDLAYIFSTFFTPTVQIGSDEDLYIYRFIKMWTNFARTGNPTPVEDKKLCDIKWESLTPNDEIKFLDINKQLKMIDNIDKKRVDVWEELFNTYYKI